VNRYESDGIATELEHNGFVKARTINDAQVCIINTCCVTSKAGMQSRQAIKKIVNSNPSANIIVTGCHAQIEPEQIRAIDNVNKIVSHKDKFKIASDLGKHNNLTSKESKICSDTTFQSFKHVVKGEMTRAYLKIQDGCNSYCSYCIIPYARGKSRSMPAKEVITNLKSLYLMGFKEAILTGIHLGAWGLDLKNRSWLSRLLHQIAEHKNMPRIRISSIEPNELTDEIIELAENSDKLCDHFHIPLQSGDDDILKSMERPYNTDFFQDLIKKINQQIPRASIGLDVIAGFPGETEKHFENTFSFINNLEISYLHVFPYSPRKGTKAYNFSKKVNNREVKIRCCKLRELSCKKRTIFEKRVMNKKFKAIIQTKRDKRTNLLKATTSNYLSILINGNDDLKGKLVYVTPEKRDDNNILHGIVN